jgi:4a-hydroxytetrahydrobiopterin dehydratase
MSTLSVERCVACRRDSPRVTEAETAELRHEVPGWQLLERDGIARLERVFHFPSFADALAFTNRVGALAEAEGHHPALLTEWGRVTVATALLAIGHPRLMWNRRAGGPPSRGDDRLGPNPAELSEALERFPTTPLSSGPGWIPPSTDTHAGRVSLLPPFGQQTSTTGFRLGKGSATQCRTVPIERGFEPSNASALKTPSVTYRKLELQWSLPQFKAGPRNHERRGVSGRRSR